MDEIVNHIVLFWTYNTYALHAMEWNIQTT